VCQGKGAYELKILKEGNIGNIVASGNLSSTYTPDQLEQLAIMFQNKFDALERLTQKEIDEKKMIYSAIMEGNLKIEQLEKTSSRIKDLIKNTSVSEANKTIGRTSKCSFSGNVPRCICGEDYFARGADWWKGMLKKPEAKFSCNGCDTNYDLGSVLKLMEGAS